MAHRFTQKVLFKHCDPAGIVFYPRYFEMLNDAVEDWFDRGLGLPFEEFHKAYGVPTVTITADFKSPSRHGDVLDFDLQVTRIGSSSMSIQIDVSSNGDARLVSKSTLVCIDTKITPTPWPNDLRDKLSSYLVAESA